MSLIRVTVCHNDTARFHPYQPADPLTPVYTITVEMPDENTATQIAEWTYLLLNIDLEVLETTHRDNVSLVNACMYRMLRLRSLSVGDVVCIDSGGRHLWMACGPGEWTIVFSPRHLGEDLPLSARVFRALVEERQR